MKRRIIKVFTAAALLAVSMEANAQINLESLFNKVAGSASSSGGNNIVSNLAAVFSSQKQASAESLVGTWVYSEPAIVFKSDNLLTKTAAKVAAGKVESKLQSYLSQYGITPGTMKVTFSQDGTFTETVKGKTIGGKWSVDNNKLSLKFADIKSVSVTTQLSGNELLIVTDATHLLNLMKGIASKSANTTLKTVSTLMKGVNGMDAGLTLKR